MSFQMFAPGSKANFFGAASAAVQHMYGDVNCGGKVYHFTGESMLIKDGKMYINGKLQGEDAKSEDEKKVVYRDLVIEFKGKAESIKAEGNVRVDVTGDVGSISSTSGNIVVEGHVLGDARTMSGNITASAVHGSVSTMSGDINVTRISRAEKKA